ncbi:proteasome subunit beta [Halosimplex rubrum]|uniref:proteasome endopeptidase complex n=1 Tax=Halosimplex rubrum TaxID=869889 RepID=A0A7D5SS73_9EURY|nr:proteasome subunit beta [Halosimplex rubrum]QLH79287.1 proteasome subunit beta [Halosimplex rubrum]
MALPNYSPADDDRLHRLPHDELTESRQIDHDAPTFDTGTTIVAIATDDGAVMAADQRASLGGRFTTNKNAEKISRVHPTGALAISGSVGPAQNLIRSLRAETSLYESRRKEPMSMRALSQTAGHLVRGLPVAPILGGVDAGGGHVYELDGGGSVMATDYAAGGSGMQVAYGVLERRFDPEATLDEATGAAVAAVEAASERDTASGNGVTVATVTADGVDIEGVGDGRDASDPDTPGEEVA